MCIKEKINIDKFAYSGVSAGLEATIFMKQYFIHAAVFLAASVCFLASCSGSDDDGSGSGSGSAPANSSEVQEITTTATLIKAKFNINGIDESTLAVLATSSEIGIAVSKWEDYWEDYGVEYIPSRSLDNGYVTVTIGNLLPSTTDYYRPYMRTAGGTVSYGNIQVFTTKAMGEMKVEATAIPLFEGARIETTLSGDSSMKYGWNRSIYVSEDRSALEAFRAGSEKNYNKVESSGETNYITHKTVYFYAEYTYRDLFGESITVKGQIGSFKSLELDDYITLQVTRGNAQTKISVTTTLTDTDWERMYPGQRIRCYYETYRYNTKNLGYDKYLKDYYYEVGSSEGYLNGGIDNGWGITLTDAKYAFEISEYSRYLDDVTKHWQEYLEKYGENDEFTKKEAELVAIYNGKLAELSETYVEIKSVYLEIGNEKNRTELTEKTEE